MAFGGKQFHCLMSCDHELANEWARCSGKNASYYSINILLKRKSWLNSLFKIRTRSHSFMALNRASEQNKHWKCLHINGNSKTVKLVYRRHDCTETLLWQMARSEMDFNLTNLACNFSHSSLRQNQKCTIGYSSCKKIDYLVPKFQDDVFVTLPLSLLLCS